MGGFAAFGEYDGLGLAELVRSGEVSPTELVEEAIRRIEALNPQLNAVVHAMYDRALEQAQSDPGTGPFAGVPFLFKDLLADFAGEPISAGSHIYDGYVAQHDSETVIRIKRAGFICVGKTNTPEFGLTPVTEPLKWGPTRNPWNLGRTAGGSSGGSAAAVAARMVPIASGGDGGGSIRIPSACCGLFGLKPTRGRVPTGPNRSEIWQGCATEHVLTRTVRDSAAVLDALHGADPGAPYDARPPDRPFLEEVTSDPGKLRIAWTSKTPAPATPDPACHAMLADVVALLRDLGHEVVEDAPDIDPDEFSRTFMTMVIGECAAEIREAEAIVGRRARSKDIEPSTAALGLLGHRLSAADFAEAATRLKCFGRITGRFLTRYDLLLTPVLAKPPVPIGETMPKGSEMTLLKLITRLKAGRILKAMGALERVVSTVWQFTPYTALYNASGQPAMSVPLFWTADGLPFGSHFVGRLGDEATLLRLAGQLEQARPWKDRKPPLVGGA